MPTIRSTKRESADGTRAKEAPHARGSAPPDAEVARYPQAGVIVDQRFAVMEFLGSTGRYLQLPIGKARFNLTTMLGPALQRPVMDAVRQVLAAGGTIRKENLPISSETGVRRVNVEVNRLDDHPSGKPVVRVLFADAAPRKVEQLLAQNGEAKAGRGQADPRGTEISVGRLKEELMVTRATLESIIEEQEIGTARLKSAYYQLESMNSELEATNEELAAANVELGTLNEALRETIRERDDAERERERMEAEIIQAQRLEGLRVMAGGVAHDFNNLLTSILGNASLLLEGLPEDSELWDAAEQIDKAAEHGAALVKQMLAFCGKGSLASEPIDLSSLVSDSVDLLRASISKTAELHCDLAKDLPAIEADATQVRQVLINLVVNASEAIGKIEGVIQVSTRQVDVTRRTEHQNTAGEYPEPGRYVCLAVSDSGHGMSAATKAKLFEPFFSTKFPGRGLGLAAVLGIVRAHHGSIQVFSSRAQGTEIEVLFPATAHATARINGPVADTSQEVSGTVLVVDDEESIRNVAQAILKQAGLRVVTAPGGREALDILRGDGPPGSEVDVVLLDLVMPGMGGKEVLEEVRSFAPRLPVIVSSGYATDQNTAARLVACGPTRFLAKPYRPTELLQKIREVLAGQRAGRGR